MHQRHLGAKREVVGQLKECVWRTAAVERRLRVLWPYCFSSNLYQESIKLCQKLKKYKTLIRLYQKLIAPEVENDRGHLGAKGEVVGEREGYVG